MSEQDIKELLNRRLELKKYNRELLATLKILNNDIQNIDKKKLADKEYEDCLKQYKKEKQSTDIYLGQLRANLNRFRARKINVQDLENKIKIIGNPLKEADEVFKEKEENDKALSDIQNAIERNKKNTLNRLELIEINNKIIKLAKQTCEHCKQEITESHIEMLKLENDTHQTEIQATETLIKYYEKRLTTRLYTKDRIQKESDKAYKLLAEQNTLKKKIEDNKSNLLEIRKYQEKIKEVKQKSQSTLNTYKTSLKKARAIKDKFIDINITPNIKNQRAKIWDQLENLEKEIELNEYKIKKYYNARNNIQNG